MSELRSADGRYGAFAQGDGNFVVYPILPNGAPDIAHPEWDQFSADDARKGIDVDIQDGEGSIPPSPAVPMPAPAPAPSPVPWPAGGGAGRVIR